MSVALADRSRQRFERAARRDIPSHTPGANHARERKPARHPLGGALGTLRRIYREHGPPDR